MSRGGDNGGVAEGVSVSDTATRKIPLSVRPRRRPARRNSVRGDRRPAEPAGGDLVDELRDGARFVWTRGPDAQGPGHARGRRSRRVRIPWSRWQNRPDPKQRRHVADVRSSGGSRRRIRSTSTGVLTRSSSWPQRSQRDDLGQPAAERREQVPLHLRAVQSRLGADGAELLPRYVRPEERDSRLRDEFLRYLRGRAGNPWTGQYNLRTLSCRRWIKDIHSNLRLGWFGRCFEPFPIVLVIRHPFAVAAVPAPDRGWRSSFVLPRRRQADRRPSRSVRARAPHTAERVRAARPPVVRRDVCAAPSASRERHVTIVLYEHLVAEPQTVLEPIFRRLGLTMTPGLLARVLLPAATDVRHGEDEFRMPSEAQGRPGRTRGSARRGRGHRSAELFGLDRLYREGPEPLTDNPFSAVD